MDGLQHTYLKGNQSVLVFSFCVSKVSQKVQVGAQVRNTVEKERSLNLSCP